MPNLLFQLITITANIIVVMFVVYYIFKLQAKEKKLEEKERKFDTEYRSLIENALAKEEEILKDAKSDAHHIIVGAKSIRQASKEPVEETLQKMLASIQKDAVETSSEVRDSYASTLKKLSDESLKDFEKVGLDLKTDLEKQIATLHATLLPGLEKELEEYKKSRFSESEKTITRVVQKVSQEILNKSLSINDHQKILIESLEKAKKEGAFD